jgi:citronellol/citronellal dehydrogenase
MKRIDLMFGINLRGTYLCSRAAVPYLKKAANPHILTLSPPLNLNPQWFKHHVAYTIAKYGMSMCVLGMAEEFRTDGIAVNALWPRTIIATAALQVLPGADPAAGRKPEIMADAAHAVLTRDSRSLTGRFLIDEEVLREAGVTDFSAYAVDPRRKLLPDLFLDERGPI